MIEARDRCIKILRQAGERQYVVAKVCGMHPVTIARIMARGAKP
jgi:hypothetical protein